MVVLDLRGISTFTDYYVICSGNSEPQIKAIAAEIQEQIEVLNGKLDAILDGNHFVPTTEAAHLKLKGKGKFSAGTKAKMAAAQKALASEFSRPAAARP